MMFSSCLGYGTVREMEEIAKMCYASDLLSGNDEIAEGSGATRALLANYSQTPQRTMPFRTPQRTPMPKLDSVMMEAENLARLRESQTPLLGGENPELHPSDFSGITPRKREIQTPNPMATPLASPGPMGLTPRIRMTPSREGSSSFGMTPRGTPIRDELHINEDMDMQDNAKLELRRQAKLKRNLRSGLISLPQPKNDYQIVIHPIPEEMEEAETRIEEDVSDRLAREREEVKYLQEAVGHEKESLEDFNKARDACQDDLMYITSRGTYGLASVASNSEKLEALQNEFENVKKRPDDEAKKAIQV